MRSLYVRGIVLAGSIVLLTGCQTSQPNAQSPGITFHETSRYFPNERGIINAEYPPRVDYQSELRIGVDPGQLVPNTASVLPILTHAENEQLDALQALVRGARDYLAAY